MKFILISRFSTKPQIQYHTQIVNRTKKLIFGIQGGVGSFNEQAIRYYLEQLQIEKYQIKYLYTSKKVLKALSQGQIDFGLFAIHNSVGGIVMESIEAMSKYNFKIVEELAIPIQHYLMKKPAAKKISAIMAHPQVFRQCAATLSQRHPNLTQISGSGDLIDTAKAAYALSKNRLPESTAILGPKTLTQLYNLEIIDSNLQDDPTNTTSFLLVSN